MKALTLTQPWATLVAIGAKRIETRSWSTSFRGPIAIHVAKTFPGACRELCEEHVFRLALRDGGYGGELGEDLPRGAVIAAARLVGCFRITRSGSYQLPTGEPIEITVPERSFGDYTPGRFAWLLADVVKLPAPIPARGSLGLWTWEAAP